MKRTATEIKADIKTLKETLSVVEGEEKKMIEDGIADLEKELSELEKQPEKKAAKADMKKEKGGGKKKSKYLYKEGSVYFSGTKNEFKIKKARTESGGNFYVVDSVDFGEDDLHESSITTIIEDINKENSSTKKPAPAKKHGKFHVIEEGLESQTVADGLILKKVKDDHYDLQHKGKSAFAFEKKSGKWHVTCKVDEKNRPNGFSTLQGAVFYVAKSVYSAELKEYIESKKKAAKRAKEFRKENPTGQTSPAKDMKNAVNKVVEKLDEKKEDGESTKRDEEAIIKQIVELVKALSPEARKKLIGMLN